MNEPAATGTALRQAPRWPSARLVTESALLGLIVGVVVVAPWTRSGYLLLLDWVSGPQQAATPKLYGLDPTALDAMPYRFATQLLRQVVGSRTTGWLLILLYFPVAAAGAAALAGGGRWRRHAAGLLMVCNPFVVERVNAGHVGFLLSVALLPWLLSSAVHARRRDKVFAARPAGWYALAMTVSPHAAWLGGVCLLAVGLLPRPRRIDLARTVVVVLCGCGVYLYAIVVYLTGIRTMQVTGADLDAYATRPGPGGLLVTVASLHGFWRDSSGLPRDVAGRYAGAVLLAVLLTAVLSGLVRLCRVEVVAGAPLAALTLTGLVLGAGVTGPVGPLYRAAFDAFPLLAAMREQQKWVALAVIGYAVAVGAAAEELARVARRHARLAPRMVATASVMVLGCVPAATAATLLWGLGGNVVASHYPQSWYTADRVMGDGSEAVLFLPWHAYQPFAFTGGRSVATPAGAFFRRPVLSSDAVELGELNTNSVSRRMYYVQRLIADAGGDHFGRLVAPLGVRYVLLARGSDAGAYGWLDRQPDLTPVLRTGELDLYRVDATGTGRVVAARAAGYPDVLALAADGELGTEAVLPGGPVDGRVPSTSSGGIRRTGATSWSVGAGPPGWVVLPEEWSPGWRAGDLRARPTTAGTVALRLDGEATSVEYAPWRFLRIGILVSVLFFAGLVAAGLVEHRRELRSWWLARGDTRRRTATAGPVGSHR